MPYCALLIAIGGLAGCGKTTLSNSIAPLLGNKGPAIVFSSDTIRKELAGVSPMTKLPDNFYTNEKRDEVYAEINRRTSVALAAGRTVVWDASLGRAHDRRAAESVADTAGVHFSGFILQAPIELRLARVCRRTANSSDADSLYIQSLEVSDFMTNGALPPVGPIIPDFKANRDRRWTVVDTSGSAEEAVARIIALVGFFCGRKQR